MAPGAGGLKSGDESAILSAGIHFFVHLADVQGRPELTATQGSGNDGVSITCRVTDSCLILSSANQHGVRRDGC
jgi:hypothetical protein